MELVTGFAGQAHVDPIDMAHVNAVAFGHDAYLLDTQNKLEPTLETANKLVVDTGDLMIQGHHFTVVQSEEIALQSGVSGQKRNALVCARYEKAEGTGIESASWIVKYGEATTGTPADPEVTTGNILDGIDSVHEEPIYRIEYDGITPGNPILLVPEFQSNASFRTSIAPNVLWQGILHMNGSQQANLSSNLNEQVIGIYLCWKEYTNGVVTQNRTYQFIPKGVPSGCAFDQFLTNRGSGLIGTKQVYVYDDRIVGDDNNSRGEYTASTTNLRMSNNRWVLTEIIGI